MRFANLAGRAVTAGLLIWIAVIHLHLWSSGYRHIHVIGLLFLANFIGAVVLALAVLAAPRRLLALAEVGAAALAAGTLAGLIVSVEVGLFGFKDSFSAPYAKESLVVEAVTIVAALAVGAAYRRQLRVR
jgi:hypothetical protein